jgi:hypothetical protein
MDHIARVSHENRHSIRTVSPILRRRRQLPARERRSATHRENAAMLYQYARTRNGVRPIRSMVRQLDNLLQRSVPLGTSKGPPSIADRGVAISTVILDLASVHKAELHDWYDTEFGLRDENDCWGCCSSSRTVEDNEEHYLASHAEKMLQRLLSMDKEAAECEGVLFERIGKITIMVNSEVCRELDLAQHLANIGTQRSAAKNSAQWIEEALKVRKKKGLPVIERGNHDAVVS